MGGLIADVGVAFGFVLIVVLAVVVAVVGFFGLILKVLAALARAVFGAGRAADGGRSDRVFPSERECRNPGCGHDNPRHAVYCGRCGGRLDD